MKTFSLAVVLGTPILAFAAGAPLADGVLKADDFRPYIETFNADDEELYREAIPNSNAWEFLARNMPLLDYPDKDLERTYYFRWWTFRKHIRRTADGQTVVTEFMPKVGWSGKENVIGCPVGHHFREGRWLRDSSILNGYAKFLLRSFDRLRDYSIWMADSLLRAEEVTGDTELADDLFPELEWNLTEWERLRRPKGGPFANKDGLFGQGDGQDGMEVSIGGWGARATLNTYLYMDFLAMAEIAKRSNPGKYSHYTKACYLEEKQKFYELKAKELAELIVAKLWDGQAQFFKVRKGDALADVRELHGYTPWYATTNFLPAAYSVAWKQLTDPAGFYAPYGPTSAERRHPKFRVSYEGHECQWNGPSWPFATSVTLTALANEINWHPEEKELVDAFNKTLGCFVRSQRRVREDGKTVPWIDENLDPTSGVWIARQRLKDWGWQPGKGGKERGKDYNHSTFCDLVINGLLGVRPSKAKHEVVIFPLVPRDTPYFCLDRVRYRGHDLCVLWDRDGTRYSRGKGLRVWVDGRERLALENLPEKPVAVKYPGRNQWQRQLLRCPDGPFAVLEAGDASASALERNGRFDPEAVRRFVADGGTLVCTVDQVRDGSVPESVSGVVPGEGRVTVEADKFVDDNWAETKLDKPLTVALPAAGSASDLKTVLRDPGRFYRNLAVRHDYGRGRVVTILVEGSACSPLCERLRARARRDHLIPFDKR